MVLLFLIGLFLVGGILGYGLGLHTGEYENWKEGYEQGRYDEKQLMYKVYKPKLSNHIR